MQEIWQFIVDNWKLIAGGCLAVLSVILQLLKKRPVCDYWSSVKNLVLEALPALILKAEKKNFNGTAKKNFVTSEAWRLIEMSYADLDSRTEADLNEWLNLMIEHILSTPQKKD